MILRLSDVQLLAVSKRQQSKFHLVNVSVAQSLCLEHNPAKNYIMQLGSNYSIKGNECGNKKIQK